MTKIELAKWVADKLVECGITDAFMLTGGGAMHLNHAVGTDPGSRPLSCITSKRWRWPPKLTTG